MLAENCLRSEKETKKILKHFMSLESLDMSPIRLWCKINRLCESLDANFGRKVSLEARNSLIGLGVCAAFFTTLFTTVLGESL